MFYLVANKMISCVINKDATKKVLMIGSLCYIILHAYLFAKCNADSAMICKYRNLIYCIFLCDIIYTGYLLFKMNKQVSTNVTFDSVNNSLEEQDDDTSSEEKEVSEEKLKKPLFAKTSSAQNNSETTSDASDTSETSDTINNNVQESAMTTNEKDADSIEITKEKDDIMEDKNKDDDTDIITFN